MIAAHTFDASLLRSHQRSPRRTLRRATCRASTWGANHTFPVSHEFCFSFPLGRAGSENGARNRGCPNLSCLSWPRPARKSSARSEGHGIAFQNCSRRRCADCIVNHRRPKRAARFGYRSACRGWSNSAGLLCPGPHPRCGTRRFTTRVAQVRVAAAPCRRFKPPNAGDYATSPWHRAVA